MNYTAESVIYGLDFMKTVVAALLAAPADPLIDTAFIRLSKDPGFAPLSTSTIAELEANECDFTGYPAGGIALVVSDPLNLSPTLIGTEASVLYIAAAPTPPDPFVDNQAFGWWVDDGTNVICGEVFAGGVVIGFSLPGDFLQLDAITAWPLFQATS